MYLGYTLFVQKRVNILTLHSKPKKNQLVICRFKAEVKMTKSKIVINRNKSTKC